MRFAPLPVLLLLACSGSSEPQRPGPAEEPLAAPGWTRLAPGRFPVGASKAESCRREEGDAQRSSSGSWLDVMSREVTQREFSELMGYDPSFNADCPDCPVDSVTFDEAALYCSRLAEQRGLTPCYQCVPAGGQDGVRCTPHGDLARCEAPRLPTALEFERAIRGGTVAGSYGGEIEDCMGFDAVADRIGWFKANSGGFTHPVASREANPWGLYDLAGNVAEWVHDELGRPRGSPLATLRGGSWYHNAHHLRSASVIRAPAERRLSYAGFRCVRSVQVERPRGDVPKLANIPRPSLEMVSSPSARQEVRVASILSKSRVPDTFAERCGEDGNCVMEALVREAASNGARLIVTPEYGLDQYGDEALPDRGARPHLDTQTNYGPLVKRFAAVADEEDVYLVINFISRRDDGREHNSVVAFDPEGTVVGRHHKFELYGGEREELTAGEAVTAFETPFGRVGLLVCADIYGQPAMHRELMYELDARIVAWSAAWTVEGATRWQSTFARDWNVFFVAANGAKGRGGGGGVFDPEGEAIGERDVGGAIVYAQIPR